jgi:hypothetical protein
MWSDHEAFKGKGQALLETGAISSLNAFAVSPQPPAANNSNNHGGGEHKNNHSGNNNHSASVSPPRQHRRGLIVRLWKPVLYLHSTGRKAEQQAIGPLEYWRPEEEETTDGAPNRTKVKTHSLSTDLLLLAERQQEDGKDISSSTSKSRMQAMYAPDGSIEKERQASIFSRKDYSEPGHDVSLQMLATGERDEEYDLFVDMAYLLNDKGEVSSSGSIK